MFLEWALDPDQDKPITEYKWINEYSSSSLIVKLTQM